MYFFGLLYGMPLVAANASSTSGKETSTLGLIATLIAAGGGLLVISSAVRSWYRRTLGRRTDRYARIARLGTSAQLSFFTSVLGEPPAMQETVVKDDYVEFISRQDPDYDPSLDPLDVQRRTSRRSFLASVFIDRDFYVQAISDDDQTVLAFSVTTRSKRFRPIYQVLPRKGLLERLRWWLRHRRRYRPLVNIKLGKTIFAELDSPERAEVGPHFKIATGAHNHAYSEFGGFGNPGHYQWFVWSASDAARQGRTSRNLHAAAAELGSDEWPDPAKRHEEEPSWAELPEIQRLRSGTVITTYTVVSAALMPQNYPLSRFGPHENYVRTVP